MTRRLVGYWCPSMPDGPLIPPKAHTDPCGKDVAVWSDRAIDEANADA